MAEGMVEGVAGAAMAEEAEAQAIASHAVPLRRSMAFRLLTFILLFSSAVTLGSTGVQLYHDYRRDLGTIEIRLNEIQASYLDSLAGSLWHVDAQQLRLQLEGILKLPDMRALEVHEGYSGIAKPLVVTVGQRQERAVIVREYPLVYDDRGEARTIGTLYVEASLEGVYQKLIETGVVILITQAVKTFLVSLFTLYIVWRLVTRHLADIARFLDRYDIRRPAAALRLARRTPRGADELDRMVAAFNGMCVSLEHAYSDLRAANSALEDDIVARMAAEAEIIRLNTQLEQRVRQRTAELEAANQELAAFSYSISHDLRAPLRRIEGFGRILGEEYTALLDERAQHCLARIRAGTQEMAEMIDSFLKLSRSTRGDLTVERVDLSVVAAEVMATLVEKDPERQVAITIDPAIAVTGDRRLLRAALTNLLENAWKYTRRTEKPTIHFGSCEVGGRDTYFVRDNGAGFDMAYVDRLFTPFNRLHKAEEFEGSGIGLATVQRILARHGGRVWAEGEPGNGATFYFTVWEGGSDEGTHDPSGRG